ncbi:MAG: hypothetical protein KKI02_01980 [Planctomycetes bacterium]|nr:hypothetical protein [Planctomycetota bacterium]
MSRIRITLGDVVVTATLNDTKTAQLIRDALPFDASAKLWGDEVYFDTPVTAGEEDAQPDVPSGTVAYWPPGKALCLFFGQTPYSPVNVVGQIEGDSNVLASVRDSDAVRVEAL